MDSKPPTDSGVGSFLWLFTVVCLIIVGTWLLWGWVIVPQLSASLKNTGAFGDSFGALNTLFAGLAFAGVVSALFMQRHELSLQREELRHQREELAGQRRLLEQRFAFEQEKEIHAAQPLLVMTPQESTLEIYNAGATVTKVRFSIIEGEGSAPSDLEVLRTDRRFAVKLEQPPSAPKDLVLRCSYIDGLGKRRSQVYEYFEGRLGYHLVSTELQA